MDLLNLDSGHRRRSNDADRDWWDRLTADSRLWSADGLAAREHFPIADPQPARHASHTKADSSTNGTSSIKSTGSSTSSGLTDGEPTGDDATSAASADSAGGARAGAGSARGAGGGMSAGGGGSAGSADASAGTASGCQAGPGQGKGRSSWVLVSALRESAQALALAPLPDDADVCLAEAEDLLFARDRITCALADRVGQVHRAGQARQHGHASTRSWLRTAAGMSVAGAGRLLTLAVELARLPRVREKFAAGVLSAGVVEAICTATARLSDEHVGLAEPILLELAGKAGPAEVAKAGRYLRAVLDPDGEERDEQADYGRRFLRVRPTAGGGLEGEFYLPREAAARLRALLDAYAKPRAEGDDRPLRVRQADAFIALMEQKIVAELLVLVNAESLPTDPQPDHPEDPAPDHSEDGQDAENAEGGRDAQGATSAEDDRDSENAENAENGEGTEGAQGGEGAGDGQDAQGAEGAASAEGGRDSEDTGVCGDTGSVDGPCPVEDGDVEDAIPGDADPGNLSDADSGDVSDAGITDAAAPAQSESPYRPLNPDTAEAKTAAAPAADAGAAADAAAGSTDLDLASAEGDDTAPPRGADRDHAAARAETDLGCAAARPAYGGSTPPHAAPPSAAQSHAVQWPDPPPEDAAVHHTHAGHQSAGDCRYAQGTPEGRNDVHHEQSGAETERGPAPGAPRPEPGTPPGEPGPRTPAGAPPGRSAGTASETLLGAVPGALLGTAPGLLLATGQMLPVSSVHRLARTSALVRLVMNAEGQVLDMGRKVRLATPAQRRAVYARYATCWIDGCPLPATMCQIDHADNWSTGGLTDLKLLGPACQFHNRDRYQHPDRYTRHKTGTDRWAFTYHRQVGARRLRI
ncbi:HNH endonuclease signature motif containing protein [Microbispora bryophytorum]|uniref:HNH endonuclease signature motif containing protein n=1 Tax=Microbispora bryophytorum TaxID=1460882 RepID=UPI0036712C76